MSAKIRFGRGKSKRKGGKKPTVTIELPKSYRRRSAYQSLQRQQGIPNFMPKDRVMKLRYVDHKTLTSTSGLLSRHQWRANACHDPDITHSGHQPYGWTELKQFYNHYVVLGSKISVKVIAQNDNTAVAGVGGLYLGDDTDTNITSYRTYIEAGKGGWRMINGGSDQPQSLSSKYSAKEFFNVTDVKDNLDRLGASVTTDPNEQAVYTLYYQASDEVSTASNLEVIVTIDYIVSFSEPKDIASS